MNRTLLSTLLLSSVLAACGPALAPDSECTRGLKESDLADSAWTGPGVKADGTLASQDVVVSTTFLRLKSDPTASDLFGSLFKDINTDLQTRQGLVAWKVLTSSRCNTARTMSVWKDEASMYAFAGAKAHAAAVAKIASLSRGGTAVTHWHDNASNVTLEQAITHIGAADAPF